MLNIFKKSKNWKVLDSSVLIDERIVGIIETGFLEGDIVIPYFIINELHTLSDSKDNEKRKKGKRGLACIEDIKNIVPVIIHDIDIDSVKKVQAVDTKIALLCREEGAKLLSLDQNLNKVAKIHNVSVLNINDLFQSIRPIVLLGDKISVRIKRKGDQFGQGIGSLEDGTMVLIDNGYKYIGKKVSVEVRQVIQNSSGKIVFAKMIEKTK